MATNTEKKSNGLALVPFVLLVVLYLCGFPMVTAILVSCVVTFFFGRAKIGEKFSVFNISRIFDCVYRRSISARLKQEHFFPSTYPVSPHSLQ